MARLGPTGLNQLLTDIKNWVNSKLSTKADTAHTHTTYAVKHTYTTAANAAKNWYRIANANTKQVYTGNPIHAEFILTAYNSSYDPGYSERWYVRAMVLGRNAHVIIFGSNTAPFNQCRVLYENTIADIDDNDRPAIDIYLNYVLANGTTKIEIEEVYNQGWTFVADGQLAVSTVPTGFENTAVSVRGNGVERSSYSDIATYLNKPRRDITSNVTLADNTTYRSTTLNCTGNRTITLPSINSNYFWCVIKNFNTEAGIITIHPSTTSVLIDGSNDDIILRPGEFVAIHSRADNSFSIVGDNRKRTCLVGRSGEVGTDTKHWFRVAQKTLNTRYRDAFILFDVFQVASDSSYMGRLCAHVRVDGTVGVVGNKQFSWLYRGTQLSDDDFAMTTIETSGTSVVVDIWCKRTGGYSAFAFAVVSEGFSTDSLDSPYGKWILTRERATVGDLESLDTGFTTVTNPSVVTLANSITGNAGSATTAQQVRKDPAAGSTADLLYSQCAGTDIFRLQVGGASNAGYAEIATADDGSEPIYVRQYKGTFTSLQRTATLLDGSGNTSFPGQVTGATFNGPLTWSGTAFSYNAGNSLYFYSGQPAIANCFEGSSSDFTKFSYPAGGTSVSSSNANIQTLRLDWGNTYWHDLFMSPNNNYLWHRNVVNSDARGWRRIVEENVTGLTDQSWNINIAGNASSATEFSATTTVALTGDATGTSAGSKKGWSVPVTLANSGVTAGSYGPSTAVSPAHGGTFSVPYVTVDAKGRVTAASSITITLPSDTNTDTLMTQNVSTTDNTYPILLCATANATSNQGAKTGIFGSGVKVNPKTSVVSAKGFSGVPTGTMYVTAVKDGGALVNSQATAWGAIWRAPTKDYQVAGATWSSTNNNVYICYSVTNANVEAGTNTMAKSLVWAADTGTLTTTTFSGALSGNASSATEFSAAKDVTLTGDVTGTASSKAGWSVATTLANSGVTAGTYGPSADVTGNNNATISVPEITVDAKGRVTSVTNRTLTCKNNTYNVYNKTLTIQKNGTNVATFTSNSNTDVTANITVPTKVSELTNDSGYLTAHQSLSNYVTLNTAQEITNTKTFKDANTVVKRTDIEAGNTLPSADKLARNIFQDKNGKELGSIFYYKNTSGNTGLCLRAGDWFSESEGVYSLNASGTNRRAELVLYTNSSGDCCIQPNGYFSSTLKALSTSVWLGESTKPFGRVYANSFQFCNASLLSNTDVQTTEEHSVGFFGQNNTPLSYITFQKRPNLKDRIAVRIQTASNSYKSYDFDATCFYPESSNSVDIGSTTNIFKNIYCNKYYKGTTAFGDIVTHNASEFLTSHQSLANYVTLNGAQTISGIKTISTHLRFSSANTRGTAPSANEERNLIDYKDSAGNRISLFETMYYTDKSSKTSIYAYKTTAATGGNIGSIGIGCDASGNVYTHAPTPASLDNSTKIATTAFVYNTAAKHLAAATNIYVAKVATGNGSGSNTSNYMALTDLRTYLATVHMHSSASNMNGSYNLQILFKAGDSFGDATFDATKMPGVRNLILNTSTGTNSTVNNYSTNSPTFGNINVTGDIAVTMRNLNCTGRISSQHGAYVSIDTYMGISSLMASNYGYLNVAKNMVINVCDAHIDYLFLATNNGILAMWPGATVTINFRQQCYYTRSLFMSSSNGTALIGYSSFKLTGTEPMAVWGGSGTLTGTSETAAATVEKAVTLASGQTFTLATNATAKVKFTVDNTAANPTLNIGGTGAKPIYWNNAPVQATMLMKNITYDVKYNGSQFVIQNAVKRLTNNDFGVFRSNGNYNQTYNSGSWNFTGWTLYYGTGIENSNWRGSHIGNIQQNVSTSNNTYPVLISGTANATANTSTPPYFASGVKINPSTSTITATTFSGALTGNVTGNCSGSSGSCTGNAATATTAGNVTGTVAIANGGTGATTRLNAVKNLTNEAVGTPTHFLAITTNYAKAGYTTVAQAKTVLGITGDMGSHSDSEYVHKTGDESITGTKTFGNGTLIVDNGTGSNVHGEIKLDGTRPVYINADNSEDGLFANTSCGMSILLNDASKSIHIGGITTGANGRKIIKTSEKVPYLTLGTQEVMTKILVPENDTADSTFSITSRLDYANGASAKSFTVRFKQGDDGSSSVFPVANNKTDLGLSNSKWKGVYATNFYEDGTALSSKYALNENFGKGTTTYLYINAADFPTGSGSSASIQYNDAVDGTKLYVWLGVCGSSSILSINLTAARVTGSTGQVWRYLGPTIYAVGLGNYGANPTGILGLFRRES